MGHDAIPPREEPETDVSDQPDAPEPQPGDGKQQIRISVPDAQKYGTYANFLVVSHTAHEFTLDFCQIVPSTPGGPSRQVDVVSRVKIPPTMVGKVITALNTNMTMYEDKHGLVKDVG